MSHKLAFMALGFAPILFVVLVMLVVLLISYAQEFRLGHSFGGAFVFATAIIGLCGLIALGMMAVKVPKVKSSSTSVNRI